MDPEVLTEEKSLDLFTLLEEEREKGYQLGKAEGEREGYQKAKEEAMHYLRLLQNITGKILEEKKRLLDHLKPEIIEFAIAVAEKVIRSELAHKEKLAKLIDGYLALAAPTLAGETVKVILSPEDLVMLEGEMESVNFDKQELKGVRLISDPTIRRGDIRIETKSALVNFVLTRELDDLRSKVLKD